MNEDIQKGLEKLAYEKTIPFCYHCYEEAPTGRCKRCFSDDLMRLLPGVGCEYGVDWVIPHILDEHLSKIDLEEQFEQSMTDCYPETVTIGWAEFDTIDALKTLDPIAWDVARNDWISSEESDGQVMTFDNGETYYSTYDLEQLLKEEEAA